MLSNNKPTQPPKLAQRFLNFFLKEELVEEVLGDLEEKYLTKVQKENTQQANWNYWFQTINYLRPFAIRNDLLTQLNPFFMFRSYFKIAWRSLFKQKLYSVINITGMTVGMTCFILIALYIQHEMSFDLQHEKADRIYRVSQQMVGNEFRGTNRFAVTPMPLIPSMKEQFPEVEEGTTLATTGLTFWKDGLPIFERGGLYLDTSFFDVFTHPVIEGNVREALKDKDAIILTETIAKKYLGEDSPIGKAVDLGENKFAIVKAVIEDVPNNQHLRFRFARSIENYEEYKGDKANYRWSSNNYWSYLVLQEDYDPKLLEAKMIPFGDNAAAELAEFNLIFNPKYYLQPLKDIHLHSNINAELGGNGDIRYIYLSASIAFIILLLALINYMNLTTARSSQRSREVGVRKVLGAQRKQLVNQFMIESILVTGLSFILAILLANLLLPAFNLLLDLKIPFSLSDNQLILLGLVAVALFLGIVAGLYPAIMSSAIAPVKALKGNWFKSRKGSGAFLRNALVIGQFAAAIVLAISSIVIYQQLRYIQTKKLGFNRDQVVFVGYGGQNMIEKSSTLRNELLQHPNIEKVAISRVLPLNTNNQGIAFKWEGKKADDPDLHIYRLHTDYHFIDLFEMEIAEGRNFSPEFPSDSTNTYILNEAAVKAIGWDAASAIGKSFNEGKVIGVVKDFHFQPFDLSIEPMYLTFHDENSASFGNVSMKVKLEDSQETLQHIKKSFKKVLPLMSANVNFMDEAYNNLYDREKRFGDAFNIFTLIALFIACIGLFGLVTHSVLLRTKEIGIRKVLGSSVSGIVGLISSDFLKLVFISALVAIPVAWWGMNSWLQDFAYRIDLQWGVFLVAGLVAIMIAFLTVGSQSLKAAWANPVDSIKSE